jgi:hypothetical protein
MFDAQLPVTLSVSVANEVPLPSPLSAVQAATHSVDTQRQTELGVTAAPQAGVDCSPRDADVVDQLQLC